MVLALVVVIQQGPQVHRQGLLFILSTLCLSIQILRTLVLHPRREWLHPQSSGITVEEHKLHVAYVAHKDERGGQARKWW